MKQASKPRRRHPVLPELAVVIAATRTATSLLSYRDRPTMTKESFGNWFHEHVSQPKCRLGHGLRKAGATRAAQNGATVAELEAIYGCQAEKCLVYTRSVDRARLAQSAMSKLVGLKQNIYSAPNQKVRR